MLSAVNGFALGNLGGFFGPVAIRGLIRGATGRQFQRRPGPVALDPVMSALIVLAPGHVVPSTIVCAARSWEGEAPGMLDGRTPAMCDGKAPGMWGSKGEPSGADNAPTERRLPVARTRHRISASAASISAGVRSPALSTKAITCRTKAPFNPAAPASSAG